MGRELAEPPVLAQRAVFIEGLAMLQAAVLECLPGPLMSRDNVRSMRADNVASGPAQPWGHAATSIEAIVPTYLGHANKRGRLDAYQLRPR